MSNKAIQWGRAKVNPVKQVKLFRENNKRLRYLEKEKIVKDPLGPFPDNPLQDRQFCRKCPHRSLVNLLNGDSGTIPDNPFTAAEKSVIITSLFRPPFDKLRTGS
jgi:hypothetical protein